ncbi:hypothetical protein [Oryza sativa Japonica Group]|uniref:Uncharacterized protein n=2 Tax=Oryza sativa subsp. japonica TaxID=39947 RepID=Q942F7_ORYSJ|nr:hypothetical protein [Oryza sativa Japonica Group]BAB89839.1 hypothetical protein [Oryza sativa Japonica Group]
MHEATSHRNEAVRSSVQCTRWPMAMPCVRDDRASLRPSRQRMHARHPPQDSKAISSRACQAASCARRTCEAGALAVACLVVLVSSLLRITERPPRRGLFVG